MTEREHVEWTVEVRSDASIGEVPIYSEAEDALYWISLFDPALHRTSMHDGATQTWTLPSTGGSYALFDDGTGALVACEDGVYELDFASSEFVKVHDAPYDRSEHRFNDGRCDPQGRFWVGTIRQPDSAAPAGGGWFYVIEGSTLRKGVGGVTVANGIAFSPNGETMYLADRVNGRVLSYDFDGERGEVSEERVFTTVGQGEILDGAAVDSRGGYWIAVFQTGEIRRYQPDGTLDRVIEFPVNQPTMCAFGGPGLGRLFVTTGRAFMTDQQIAAQPDSGSIFSADVGETGISEPRFARHPRTTPVPGTKEDA